MLCGKYEFSASTLRRWKEQHDKTVYLELSKVGANGLKIFICIPVSVLIIAVVFSKAAATFFIPLLLCFFCFHIVCFRKVSARFVDKEKVTLSRIGFSDNALYKVSWMFILLCVVDGLTSLIH